MKLPNRVCNIFLRAFLMSVLLIPLHVFGAGMFGKWDRITDNVKAADLRGVCAFSDRVLVVVGSTGVIVRTSDGGDTWNAVRVDSADDFYGVAAYDSLHGALVGENGVVMSTSDGGIHWIRQKSHTNKPLRSLAFFLGSLQAVAVGDSGTIVESQDGGIHWDVVPIEFFDPILKPEDMLVGVAISSTGSSGIAVSSNGRSIRVYPSVGGGLDFAYGGTLQSGVTHLQCSKNGLYWAGGSSWVLSMTANGGKTWSDVPVDSVAAKTHLPRNAFFGLVGSQNGFFVVPKHVGEPYKALYNSLDGGLTWVLSEDSFSTGEVTGSGATMPPAGRAVCSIDSENVLVCGDKGWLAASTDAGASWKHTAYCQSCFDKQIGGVRFSGDNIGYLFCSIGQEMNVIQKTTDGGWNWVTQFIDTMPVTNLSVFRTMSVPSPNICVVAGDNGYVRLTKDGGKSWTKTQYSDPGGGQPALRVSMYDTLHGFLAGSRTLFATEDGGRTFTPVADPPWIDESSILDVAVLSAHSCALLVYLPGPGVTMIRYTGGNGNNWWADSGMFPQFQKIWQLCFVDSLHGWGIGGNNLKSKIVRTSDGGLTWTLVRDTAEYLWFPIDSGAAVLTGIAFADVNNGIVTGMSNLLLRTTDGGEHWLRQDDGTNTLENYNSSCITFPSVRVAVVPKHDGLLRYEGDQLVSGVEERDIPLVPAADQLHEFPNPVESDLQIIVPEGSGATMMISDMMGRTVFRTHEIGLAAHQQYTIWVASLLKGAYVASVTQSGHVYRAFFVKCN